MASLEEEMEEIRQKKAWVKLNTPSAKQHRLSNTKKNKDKRSLKWLMSKEGTKAAREEIIKIEERIEREVRLLRARRGTSAPYGSGN